MQSTIIIVLSAPELPVLTSSNGINTSAIGIERNAVFCYFQIFHGRFGDLCCFVVTLIRRNLCFLVLIFVGQFASVLFKMLFPSLISGALDDQNSFTIGLKISQNTGNLYF